MLYKSLEEIKKSKYLVVATGWELFSVQPVNKSEFVTLDINERIKPDIKASIDDVNLIKNLNNKTFKFIFVEYPSLSLNKKISTDQIFKNLNNLLTKDGVLLYAGTTGDEWSIKKHLKKMKFQSIIPNKKHNSHVVLAFKSKVYKKTLKQILENEYINHTITKRFGFRINKNMCVKSRKQKCTNKHDLKTRRLFETLNHRILLCVEKMGDERLKSIYKLLSSRNPHKPVSSVHIECTDESSLKQMLVRDKTNINSYDFLKNFIGILDEITNKNSQINRIHITKIDFFCDGNNYGVKINLLFPESKRVFKKIHNKFLPKIVIDLKKTLILFNDKFTLRPNAKLNSANLELNYVKYFKPVLNCNKIKFQIPVFFKQNETDKGNKLQPYKTDKGNKPQP